MIAGVTEVPEARVIDNYYFAHVDVFFSKKIVCDDHKPVCAQLKGMPVWTRFLISPLCESQTMNFGSMILMISLR